LKVNKIKDPNCLHPFARFATDYLTTLCLKELRKSTTIIDIAGKIKKTKAILDHSKDHEIQYKWHRAVCATYD
jgi:hypothetical protein